MGSAGLHNRVGEGGLEIGYWVRSGWTGRGIAADATAALTHAALALPGIDRVEICHDAANVASERIPAKLGYARAGERPARGLRRQPKPAATWSGSSPPVSRQARDPGCEEAGRCLSGRRRQAVIPVGCPATSNLRLGCRVSVLRVIRSYRRANELFRPFFPQGLRLAVCSGGPAGRLIMYRG